VDSVWPSFDVMSYCHRPLMTNVELRTGSEFCKYQLVWYVLCIHCHTCICTDISDKHSNTVLLVSNYPHDFWGHQQSRRIQLEDRTCSYGSVGPGVFVHDQRNCLFWKGKLI